MLAAWEAFNSEDSWLPLILPLIIWVGCFVYCHMPSASGRRTFHQWQSLHNFHNYGGILLALTSIYINDDAIFNERITILWTFGYFVVDFIDCAGRMDKEYTLHAIFCLILSTSNYLSPVCRVLRMNSKALLCELSSPFLLLSKRTREPLHFALFALAFTLCRVLWIPVLIYQARDYGLKWLDYRVLFLNGFYCLNLFWYYKILRILVNGIRGKETKEV